MSGERPKPRVLLIREWEEQLSSSGCCGRIEGDFLDWRETGRCFAGRREEMEKAGRLYRAIRERYGERVDVRIVDPRNLVSLVPILLREFWTRRVPPAAALRTLAGLSVRGVVLDGRLFARDRWPAPGELFRVLDDRAAAPRQDADGPGVPAAQPDSGTASTSSSSARSRPSSPGPPPR